MNRNLGSPTAPGEQVEAEIDALILRRHSRRVLEAKPGERDEEAAWCESERRHAASRREQNRALWSLYHEEQAERLRRTLETMISFHENEAEKHLPKGA